MLELSAISASYGSVPAISDVSIAIGEGEAVGLLGANGAGKSTTLRAISGLVRLTSGKITFLGTNLASLPAHKIPELGIAHVPEGRQVFPEMTVEENLEIGSYVPKAKAERRRECSGDEQLRDSKCRQPAVVQSEWKPSVYPAEQRRSFVEHIEYGSQK